MTAVGIALGQKATSSVTTFERKLQNSPGFVFLIIVTFMLFSAVLVFNGLASNPQISGGIFLHGISNVSKEFPLNITPADWAFTIWGVIYALQVIWNFYSLGLLCRSTSQGPAYLNPIVLSPAYLIFFNLSSALNIAWLFMWDRLLFFAAFMTVFCIALTLLLALAVVSSRLVMFRDTLINQGRNSEVIFLQVVVINGIAMYATWTFIASLINTAVVMAYALDQTVENEVACIICLGILSFITVLYIGLDVILLKSNTEYTLTPYAVVMWALAASLSKNYNQSNVSSMMSAVLLGAVSLAFVMKLGITFYNSSNVRSLYRRLTVSQ